MPEGLAEVEALGDLAADFSIVGMEELGGIAELAQIASAPDMSAAFALAPRGSLTDFIRAARERGETAFTGLIDFLSARASGFWQRIRAFFLAVMRSIGLVASESSGISVLNSPSAYSELYAAPARSYVFSAPASVGDRFDLGYSLVPAR